MWGEFSDFQKSEQKNVFTGVLDHAVVGGGEHPSSQIQQASPNTLQMDLPPGFPLFPPTRGFYLQPQVSGQAVRESPLEPHFPFHLC